MKFGLPAEQMAEEAIKKRKTADEFLIEDIQEVLECVFGILQRKLGRWLNSRLQNRIHHHPQNYIHDHCCYCNQLRRRLFLFCIPHRFLPVFFWMAAT